MIANPNDGNSPRVEVATPTIDVSAGGLITATTEQAKGYVPGGTKSATQQLTTQGAATITPTTTNQTAVASGRYTTGDVVVSGDANLVPENIAEGVSIFGVTGTHSGGGGSATVTLISQYCYMPEGWGEEYGFLAVNPNGSVQKYYVEEYQTVTFKVMQNSFALPMSTGDFFSSEQVSGNVQIINEPMISVNGHETRLVFIYGDCTITV